MFVLSIILQGFLSNRDILGLLLTSHRDMIICDTIQLDVKAPIYRGPIFFLQII